MQRGRSGNIYQQAHSSNDDLDFTNSAAPSSALVATIMRSKLAQNVFVEQALGPEQAATSARVSLTPVS